MKRRAQQGRRYRWVLLASVWLVMAVNVFAESASVRPSGNVQLDLRTDVGWETDHFRYMGQDFSEALLMQAGQTVDLTLLTHKTVPHRCMLDFSHDYCDDRGHLDTWGRSAEPVVCAGTTPASRSLLTAEQAGANQLCITFRGGFSYPAAGAGVAPDLASHYRARVGEPESGADPETVALTLTLTLDSEQPLHRLSSDCYGSVCTGDTLSSVQATTKVPLEIISGKGVCGRVRSDQWPVGLSAQFRDSRIARLQVKPPSFIRTDTGVALGESPPLYELYEDELEETLEAGPGSLPVKAVYWQVRGEKGLQFFFDSNLQLTAMAAGGESLTEEWPCR
ncbi:hypothetical protein [Alcanivorax sp.]|uniref:hypothetical protein n=1 Tax=Alcanivorax sp. TaxID=1872427 RepID=UPI0032D8FE27